MIINNSNNNNIGSKKRRVAAIIMIIKWNEMKWKERNQQTNYMQLLMFNNNNNQCERQNCSTKGFTGFVSKVYAFVCTLFRCSFVHFRSPCARRCLYLAFCIRFIHARIITTFYMSEIPIAFYTIKDLVACATQLDYYYITSRLTHTPANIHSAFFLFRLRIRLSVTFLQ